MLLLRLFALLYRFLPVTPDNISITRSQLGWAWDDLPIIENQTLGVSRWLNTRNRSQLLTATQFGKIYVISLPNRADKRDNIVLGSSVCDFQVEFVDGVIPDSIPPKTYPYVRRDDSRFFIFSIANHYLELEPRPHPHRIRRPSGTFEWYTTVRIKYLHSPNWALEI